MGNKNGDPEAADQSDALFTNRELMDVLYSGVPSDLSREPLR